MAAIELRDVSKRYGRVTALEELSLTVERGEVFGFLGPNGAGKSTTIDILLDHARPSDGEIRVLGMDAQQQSVSVRKRTGVLPEDFGPLGEMTGHQHVSFAIEAKDGTEEPTELLERVGVAHAANRPVTQYSKGMAQRLMLAMALAGEPDLLILDEPTTGLDPNGARQLRTIVEAERDRGATVFFSSHILGQVEPICDRVGILNSGSLVAVDTIQGLRDAAGATSKLAVTLDSIPKTLKKELQRIDGIHSANVSETTLAFNCTDMAKGEIIKACHRAGATVENIETRESSLEDLFAAYTGGA